MTVTPTTVPQPLDVALEQSRAVLARARASRLADTATRNADGTWTLHERIALRRVIDVTDRLTPGAKAAAVERARVSAMLAAGTDRARLAFDDGRAYERGAAVRRLIGRTPAAREARVVDVARTYLEDGDPRRAALVLAGYTATEVTR